MQLKKCFYDKVMYSALAKNTRITYEKGWQHFSGYCSDRKINPFSATSDEIIGFLIELATKPRPRSGKTLSMGTITLYQSAINRQYIDSGKTPPVNHPKIKTVLKGLSRIKGNTPRKVKAIREHHIAKILKQCDSTLIGIRDAAIISLGFAGALRRSEICELNVEDIEILHNAKGNSRMIVNIRKSKTDQESKGQKIAIPEGKFIRPIDKVQNWLKTARIHEGPLFQTMRRGGKIRGSRLHHSDIPRLVKNYAKSIGLNPKEFSAHSLRAGFVTSAAVHNARLDKIMEVTRHKNPATVMQYIRDTNSFQDHAGKKFL